MAAGSGRSALAASLAAVQRRIADAAARGGRDPGEVRLVAVTKGWPGDVVTDALALGLTRLGENRIQEAEPKIAAHPEAEWHLLGPIQSNKVRRAVAVFDTLQAIDSFELLGRINDVSGELGRRPRVLWQVNLTVDPTRHGMAVERFEAALRSAALVEAIRAAAEVEVTGLMGIAPFVARPEDVRPAFRTLARLHRALQEALGRPLPDLSMGMSGDFEVAVEEGATFIRVGTALFGQRQG
jgi:pyridoxal phosphate enzyme (YggS family)